MDSRWSDSYKGELDSVASTDSLQQFVTDEFHARHLSTPDVSNIELSKRVALLELENERLRTDLENMRIELNARIAANEGLKGKITELYVEMQVVVQQKQKLQNTLTDVTNRLDTSEASAKWYQSQVHGLQASRKTLQLETDTYQGILHKRQQTIATINSRYKQLNMDYTELMQRHQKEKQDLEREIQSLKAHNNRLNCDISESSSTGSNAISVAASGLAVDISTKLESTENELRDTKAELKTLEKRLLSSEVSKASMENALVKQRALIATMEGNMQRCESEKNQATDALRKTQLDVEKLKSENEALQTAVLSSKQEQSHTENAIFQLQIQLTKMIARYKLLRAKNTEAETKLSKLQDVISENARLKRLSYEANSTLIRKLRHEKQRVKSLENKLRGLQIKEHENQLVVSSLESGLKQALTTKKSIQARSKVPSKNLSESIHDDEGYGDSSITSSVSIDIPSPRSLDLDPILMYAAANVLCRSKDFSKPVQTQLDHLRCKLKLLQEHVRCGT